MKDFDMVLAMLTNANEKFYVEEVEGEHPCVNVPSPFPEYYTTGVTFSFNLDGSLYSVHPYEPDDE